MILRMSGTLEYKLAFRDNAFPFLGQKTCAFASNIAYANSEEVTIDLHAVSVARGYRFTTQTAQAISRKQYQFYAEAYTIAAAKFDLSSYELQAIVWCVWRRLNNVHAVHG